MPAAKAKKKLPKKLSKKKKVPVKKAKKPAKTKLVRSKRVKAKPAPVKPAPARLNYRVEVTYKGRVQGVGFRFNAEKVALECGVKGWVRNEQNGDVQLVAEGSRAVLDQMLEGIRQCPVGRHIAKEHVRWEPCRNEFDDFRIEYHFC